jgi:hypothetical protein
MVLCLTKRAVFIDAALRTWVIKNKMALECRYSLRQPHNTVTNAHLLTVYNDE